jgi:DNA invertase Pin-like site-specific DNA recombinase
MLGVFAEFERGIIRERVNAGLARASANGTKLGRRRVKPAVEQRILELRAIRVTAFSRSEERSASVPASYNEFSSIRRGSLDRNPVSSAPSSSAN